MICERHKSEASGVCPYCGAAICPSCEPVRKNGRRACSEVCMTGLLKIDEASSEFLSKGKKSLKANVVFCLILGILFILFAVPTFLVTPSIWPLGLFLGVMGAGFVCGGIVYANALKTKT
jgi:hypothetical protein